MKSNYIPGANEEEKRMLMAAIVRFVPDKCSICGEEMIKRGKNELEAAVIHDYVRLHNGEFCHLECYNRELCAEVGKMTEPIFSDRSKKATKMMKNDEKRSQK